MRIVDYDEFVRMPAGTVFAPFEPNVFCDRFGIKTDGGEEYTNIFTGEKSWAFNGVMPLEPWLDCNWGNLGYGKHSVEFEIYDGDSNDAREYKMFAVLEPQDVKELINALYWALDGCPGDTHHHYKEQEV